MNAWSAINWTFANLRERFIGNALVIQPSLRQKDERFRVRVEDYIDYILGAKTPAELNELDGRRIKTS